MKKEDKEYVINIKTHQAMMDDLNKLTVKIYGGTLNSNKILTELIYAEQTDKLLEFYLQTKKQIGLDINKMVGLFNLAHELISITDKDIQ